MAELIVSSRDSFDLEEGDADSAEELVARGIHFANPRITQRTFPIVRHPIVTRKVEILASSERLWSSRAMTIVSSLGRFAPTYEDALYFWAIHSNAPRFPRIVFLHEPRVDPFDQELCVLVLDGMVNPILSLQSVEKEWGAGTKFAAVLPE